MDRNDFVLAVFATSDGAIHTPVQVQKLFFLIDKKTSEEVGGPYFDFSPYDYGPFDIEVYNEISRLSLKEDMEIVTNQRFKKYKLTTQGQKKGEEILNSLDEITVEYIKKLSEFVRSLSFAELVSTIYKAYPEMKVNSVFRG